MNRKSPTALPLLAALSLGVLALPLAAETPADQAFARLDANGNGSLSREEFLDLRRQMFAALDANGDGFLTREEIEAARAGGQGGSRMQRNTRVWQQDANGDGRLSLAEYTAQTRGFDLADQNGDGALSRAEFTRIARYLAPKQ